MDVSGEHQLDVEHSVYRQRISESGVLIEETAQQYQMDGEEGAGPDTAEPAGDKLTINTDIAAQECGRFDKQRN